MGWTGGRGAGAAVRGGKEVCGEGRVWKGDGAGRVGAARDCEAWKRLHWLSKIDAFCFHSAQLVGMGCRR